MDETQKNVNILQNLKIYVSRVKLSGGSLMRLRKDYRAVLTYLHHSVVLNINTSQVYSVPLETKLNRNNFYLSTLEQKITFLFNTENLHFSNRYPMYFQCIYIYRVSQ